MSLPMKGSAKRKCLCCGDFFAPDHRNARHQRYCGKSACGKESKAQSQRRWLQRPENQNYFRGPENCRRVKDWRKAHPGYGRKKKSRTEVPLQEVFQAQVVEPARMPPLPRHTMRSSRVFYPTIGRKPEAILPYIPLHPSP